MANDLATGLKLGLDAARMAGAWDEAELDREHREAMQRQQQTFTSGESEKERDLRNKIYKGNNEVKRLESLRDQANRDRDYKQRDKHEDARMKRASEVLGYQHEMKIWQDRQAGARHTESFNQRAAQQGVANELAKREIAIREKKLEQETRLPFQRYNDSIHKSRDDFSKSMNQLQSRLQEVNNSPDADTAVGTQLRQNIALDMEKLHSRHREDVKFLEGLRDRSLKEGGPKVEMGLTPNVDPDSKVVTWNPQIRVSGTNIGSDAAKDIADQLLEIQKQLQTGMNPLGNPSGAPGGGGAGTPPVGAPPLPPLTPGYGQPGNAIQ